MADVSFVLRQGEAKVFDGVFKTRHNTVELELELMMKCCRLRYRA